MALESHRRSGAAPRAARRRPPARRLARAQL